MKKFFFLIIFIVFLQCVLTAQYNYSHGPARDQTWVTQSSSSYPISLSTNGGPHWIGYNSGGVTYITFAKWQWNYIDIPTAVRRKS